VCASAPVSGESLVKYLNSWRCSHFIVGAVVILLSQFSSWLIRENICQLLKLEDTGQKGSESQGGPGLIWRRNSICVAACRSVLQCVVEGFLICHRSLVQVTVCGNQSQ